MSVELASQCTNASYNLPVEDPVLDATVGLIGLIGSLVPEVLDLLEEAVLVLLGALLDLLSLRGDVVLELVGVP